MSKNKLLLLLALLLTAATGAWATEFTSLKVGDVLHAGDVINTGTNYTFLNKYLDAGMQPATVVRANIGAFDITESETGAYYLIKGNNDYYYGIIRGDEVDYDGGHWPVTATSDGIVVTAINPGGYTELTFAVHEDAASSTPKHLITATYDKQTRSLEQPLPYATTIGELYEAVTGESFSDLLTTMTAMNMPLTGIGSNNTSVVSIGELNGASTPVTVIADGKATVGLNFSGYVRGSYVSVVPPLYVSLKDGVKDADKWTVKVGDGQAQALPIGGLTGDGSETVTLQYTGRLKVKGVKATSDAAPAEASVPDGALSGKFSVSDGKQVYFSKGNLRYASSKWSFFDNQYDRYTSHSEDAWDHFGWSTSATTYGMNTSTVRSDYSGDFVDWGATMGTGWRMLTSDEWTYLFNTRSASTVGGTENGRCAKAKVNNVRGVILFPDTYTHPDGVTAPTGVNSTGDTGWNGNSYTAADWAKMETAGCVFLPAAGYRNGSSVNNPGSVGDYSSATPSGTEKAYELYFSSGSLNTASEGSRYYGLSVRLVSEVATSDAGAAAKEPATVTTAPTGAAIVGVGKTTALVSGGAAEGGTMMYKVTTENTKPASTDGFSEAVPTAQGITASGKVYVWYYVKGDDTHSDSEIAATAIEVPVADVVWDATNATDIYADGYGTSYEKEGVTLSGNDGEVYAWWENGGISFSASEMYGFTFTAPTGKAFTKIEMIAKGSDGWNAADLGTGWAFSNPTVTWTGSAASTVKLLTDDVFEGAPVTSIGFYLSE